jgi:hypothetical protein
MDVRSRPNTVRSRTERARFSGRSREGVRVRKLTAQFVAEVGTDIAANPGLALLIRDAAELLCLAETTRGRMLRGETVDLTGLIRLEGVSKRAVDRMRAMAAELRAAVKQQEVDEAFFGIVRKAGG